MIAHHNPRGVAKSDKSFRHELDYVDINFPV